MTRSRNRRQADQPKRKSLPPARRKLGYRLLAITTGLWILVMIIAPLGLAQGMHMRVWSWLRFDVGYVLSAIDIVLAIATFFVLAPLRRGFTWRASSITLLLLAAIGLSALDLSWYWRL